ncbi:hypothetical protein U1Q18_049180 [Sarracenia purpurea var. burkii]
MIAVNDSRLIGVSPWVDNEALYAIFPLSLTEGNSEASGWAEQFRRLLRRLRATSNVASARSQAERQSTNWGNTRIPVNGRWIAFVFPRTPRSSNPNNSSYHLKPFNLGLIPNSANRLFSFRRYSGLPSPSAFYGQEFNYRIHNFGENYALVSEEDVDTEKIPIKAYFLYTRER